MELEPNRFEQAIERIDCANALDPHRTLFAGEDAPAELIYGRRMTAWLMKLDPHASEALRLAVRCQHLRRWDIPRAEFPITRAGYHQWRTRLAHYHADRAAEIIRTCGYNEPTVARVQSLIRKERFKTDPEAQMLEDVACLVFLELDYVEFAQQHERQKVIVILQKTWKKMSDAGHAAAIELAATLPPAQRSLIVEAIQ